jgi:hypothetical protein
MKQTAVEWLWDMLLIGEFINDPEELLNQAKAMEKEQMIEFAIQYMFGRTDIGSNLRNDFIQKYNETFKSE